MSFHTFSFFHNLLHLFRLADFFLFTQNACLPIDLVLLVQKMASQDPPEVKIEFWIILDEVDHLFAWSIVCRKLEVKVWILVFIRHSRYIRYPFKFTLTILEEELGQLDYSLMEGVITRNPNHLQIQMHSLLELEGHEPFKDQIVHIFAKYVFYQSLL